MQEDNNKENMFQLKGVIWCDFKSCFLFGVLHGDCA